MTGHIHDPDLFAVWKSQPAEAELDGHLARLLFLEAIGMGACQRSNQRGFSVVNVTGGTNNPHETSFLFSSFPLSSLFLHVRGKKKEERKSVAY
jgi:hypothetical protein